MTLLQLTFMLPFSTFKQIIKLDIFYVIYIETKLIIKWTKNEPEKKNKEKEVNLLSLLSNLAYNLIIDNQCLQQYS